MFSKVLMVIVFTKNNLLVLIWNRFKLQITTIKQQANVKILLKMI
jgi:hypothetical protein